MKIVVEFNSWEEMELFRTSGKTKRSKKEDEAPVEEVAQAIREAQPVQAAFTAPAPPPPPVPSQGFPGGNGATPPVNPLVKAIWERIDGAIASGQPADNVVIWFRNQIGPDAAQATLDQIKQVFIPRMSEQQLRQIMPLLGITAG